MSEETKIEQDEVAVSEPTEVQPLEENESQEQEQTMVPLAALQAERRKRQELQEFILKSQQAEAQPVPEPEDPNALVEKRDLQLTNAATKREILETLYQDMNPEAVQKINKYLQPILEKKPWLAASVDSAQNRYARAYEIVNDYMHLVESKPSAKIQNNDGARIVQNANKPKSPVESGKSAMPSGLEYLKSIQGTKEFREYREKVRRG